MQRRPGKAPAPLARCKPCHLTNEAARKRTPEQVEQRRANSRRSRHRLRERVLDFLGGRCARCGFDDHRAMQVDHVNSDGWLERQNTSDAYAIYRRILAGAPGYQLLCANCNAIKKWEDDEFPYRRRSACVST